ncbi:cyclase family protein [Desulfosporosinus sp. BICA1-9]|uniref:cyclase family protein n=1 Tax=Desulfosporosinus sp. BICA1-9 TaxID=1531958 RepID=UPI00054C1731|nr:cyclase family protein [Desulfosporosinus sp. BICA1-9]KJS47415.1 MAG: hypothetical protein VR66_19775 [Peptococcaceae bacterium BRH_c23]KJS88329.1 MAG: hypothetical protein JL57_12110 [Desulfosporosinus sp. BICA1-9]
MKTQNNWLHDLSQPIASGYGELPGHPSTILESFQFHETHGRNNASLTMSIHVGTHVDAPYHFYTDGKTIDRVAPEIFCGQAVIVDLVDKVKNDYAITVVDVKDSLVNIGVTNLEGWRLILHTGWSKHYNTSRYYSHNPHISMELAHWLVDSKVPMIGLDFPPDGIGDELVVPAPAPVHQILLKGEVCILENLTALDELPERKVELICLPIKLVGASGGPARALARARRG